MNKVLKILVFLSLSLSVACATNTNKSTSTDKATSTSSVKSTLNKKLDVKTKLKTSYTCLVKKDKREVTLDNQPKRCEVHYTKFGDKTQVVWAQSTPSICTDVYSKIRKNIEDRGFKCTDNSKIEKTAKLEEIKRNTANTKK